MTLIKPYTWFNNISVTDKLWLQNSTDLVLQWLLLFQRSDVTQRNEWSNFTKFFAQNFERLKLCFSNFTLVSDMEAKSLFNSVLFIYRQHDYELAYVFSYTIRIVRD